MANKYWVPGGSGTWNTVGVNTNWSATSGGARTANPPAGNDDIFFDNNSGNPTVGVIGIGGIPFDSLQMLGPCTLTLTNNLNLNQNLTINAGTLNTSTFNLTADAVVSSDALSKTLNLGSGVHTFSTATGFTTSGANFTFNAGTSVIQLTSATATLSTQGLTFNNVSFTSTSQTASSISGANTFNNLTIAGRTSTGINPFNITNTQIINGTLTLSAGSIPPARTFIKSSVIGQQVELQVNSFASTNDIDFRDIKITGAASPIDATLLRFGNCNGNDGIDFALPKEVFYRATASANWGATGAGGWSLTSGGTAVATAFPLAQDTATFPTSPTPYPTSGNTVTINSDYNIGTIKMGLRTSNTMTLAFGSNDPIIYGNLVTGTGTTYTGTGSNPIVFSGKNTQNITSAGKVFTRPISVNSPGGTVNLLDAFDSSSTSDSFLVAGTWNLNGYNTTIRGHLILNGTRTRSIVFNGSTLFLGIAKSGGTVWDASSPSGLTLDGTGTISIQSISGTKTFNGGNIQNYSNIFFSESVSFGGLTITGSNKFNDISNQVTTSGSPVGLRFTGGTTNEFGTFNVNGDFLAQNLPLRSTNTTQATLRKSTTWFMGANSTNVVGNTGLTFTAGGGIDRLAVSYINGISDPAPTPTSTGNFFAILKRR